VTGSKTTKEDKVKERITLISESLVNKKFLNFKAIFRIRVTPPPLFLPNSPTASNLLV